MTLLKILAELDACKHRFGMGDVTLLRTLEALSVSKLDDVESLARLHELLLFFRAYPVSPRILKKVEVLLKAFQPRINRLRRADADLSPLDDPEVSGIVGTSVTSNFSYQIVRWLVEKYPSQVSIDWDWFEEEERFGANMKRFLPLLPEDAMVEAHVPYHDWLRAATGRKRELDWLIGRFESLAGPEQIRAELYDSLKLHVTWRFGIHSSRTAMKRREGHIFFHKDPLIQRRDVSLLAELASPPISIERLEPRAGAEILDMARETSAVRYRELHGFTFGDWRRVLKAELGRGIQVYVMGVPPESRLPLRAYHAALILKNGVPVGYFEGLSFFERMESGFNLYYTFRDGETAWLFARMLRLMRQLLGVTVFSIDPYQIGHENEEGIESGAFWFYRKLGFRPVRPELLKLTLSEERRMSTNRAHRTSVRMLRKLAAGQMIFEGLTTSRAKWDRFQIRNLGLRVQQLMAAKFDSDAARIRSHSMELVKSELNLRLGRLSEQELRAFEDLALILAMVPDLPKWNPVEKKLARQIVTAKAGRNEALYLKLMQRHDSLRAAVCKLGS